MTPRGKVSRKAQLSYERGADSCHVCLKKSLFLLQKKKAFSPKRKKKDVFS